MNTQLAQQLIIMFVLILLSEYARLIASTRNYVRCKSRICGKSSVGIRKKWRGRPHKFGWRSLPRLRFHIPPKGASRLELLIPVKAVRSTLSWQCKCEFRAGTRQLPQVGSDVGVGCIHNVSKRKKDEKHWETIIIILFICSGWLKYISDCLSRRVLRTLVLVTLL